jgi:poly(3-hydroxybutyrate) depolymerase
MNILFKNVFLSAATRKNSRSSVVIAAYAKRQFIRSSEGNKLYLSLVVLGLLLFPFISSAQLTTLRVGSTDRSLFVYTPSGLQQNRPLLISLHGMNQDINYQKDQAKWELVADTAKFVVVYPAGIDKSWDISGNRDTDFILAIIESMVTRYGIDRNRVYVSGFSMGGMMSYHAANKIADKIAAIAPVGGYLFANPVSSSRPMPIIHTHGTSDDVVGYSGVASVLQKWRNWNSCPSQGVHTKPYPANIPSSKSTKDYWAPCESGSEVVLLTLDGKGHWHSNDNAGVHTTKEIWNFIRKFSLNPGPSISFISPLDKAVFSTNTPIELSVSASSPNGTISDVKFYNGTTLLDTDNTTPYSYSWTNVAVGTYTLRAVLTDSQGKTAETSISIKVNVPQGPYNGTWHVIPGTIQLENYDVGGNGIAYMDDSPGSSVTPIVNFRTDEDVDIENCTDFGGGYNIGFATAGEWLEYSVDVEKPGTYDLDLRVAADGTSRTVSVSMDGVNIASNVVISNTGGWQTWQTTTVKNIDLQAGKQILRVTIGATDYVNLNYVTFKLIKERKQEPFHGTAHTIPGRIQAEDYDLGGEGLAFHEANAEANEGGADYRTDEVDIEETQDIDGAYNIAYIMKGEWLEYTVNVTSDGIYDLDLRMAADGANKTLHIEMDGKDVSGAINVPNTGGWQTWQTVTVKGINLTAGEHVMRIAFDSDYMNLNYFEFRDVITGVNEMANSSIKIFPNPFKNTMTVSAKGDFNYQIINNQGLLLESGLGNNQVIIGNGLQSGTYILKITIQGEEDYMKFVKY